MRDHYETLDIPESAGAAWVHRAAAEARRVLEADRKQGAAARQSALDAIAEAQRVLSDPTLRHQYDKALDRARQRRLDRSPVVIVRKLGLVMTVVFSVVAIWHFHAERERERAQLAAERAADEAAELRRRAQLVEERRLAESRLEREAQERQEAEAARLNAAQKQRSHEVTSQRFVSDAQVNSSVSQRTIEAARREREQAELRDKFEQARQKHRAEVELERHKQSSPTTAK